MKKIGKPRNLGYNLNTLKIKKLILIEIKIYHAYMCLKAHMATG